MKPTKRSTIARRAVLGLAFLLLAPSVLAKEAYVRLKDYCRTAEAICLCTVVKDNGDRTVTIRTEAVLKGDLGASEVVRGDTGHCVLHGPVSRFMKPGERHVVFLFAGNTVGRLGGILPVHGKTLHARFIDGFAGGEFDRKEWLLKLPLEKALGQIRGLLKGANPPPGPEPPNDGPVAADPAITFQLGTPVAAASRLPRFPVSQGHTRW